MVTGAFTAPVSLAAQQRAAAGADTIVPRMPALSPAERTIFYRPKEGADTASLGRQGDEPLPRGAAVRVWEYVSAPFVVDPNQRPAGHCAAIDALAQPGAQATSVVRYGDRLPVALLAGAAVANGTRFILARPGPLLDQGLVMVPTGVVRITASGGVNTPATAEVIAQFEDITCDDELFGLELPRDTSRTRPAPVAGGAVGRVIWIEGTALLPSLQHVALINLGARDGLQPGDQVTLMTHDYAANGTATLADAAVATVLRVSARASSAIVIKQSRAAIEVGMPVRVSAKLP